MEQISNYDYISKFMEWPMSRSLLRRLVDNAYAITFHPYRAEVLTIQGDLHPDLLIECKAAGITLEARGHGGFCGLYHLGTFEGSVPHPDLLSMTIRVVFT